MPVRHLRFGHISNSFSRLVVGPYDHRFLVHRSRKHRDTCSVYRVHSVTAWEPGWKVVKSLSEVRELILTYSHNNYR